MYGFQFSVFTGFLIVRTNESPFLVPSPGLFVLFALSNSFVLVFVFLIMFYYYPWNFVCFLMRDRTEMDQDGRRSGRSWRI